MVFLASTINGYEGTGRSLSLKLLSQLREQAAGLVKNDKGEEKLTTADGKDNDFIDIKLFDDNSSGRKLYELVLDESIRYKPGDQVSINDWLYLFTICLD